MTQLSAYFTVFATFLLLTACGSKTSGGNAASTAPAASAQPQALVAAASQPNVAPGATVTFSVIGGMAPYTWSITSGGGTLNSSTGASVIYTASSSAGMAYLRVNDSSGNSATASVNVVVGGGTINPNAGKVCTGNYAVTLGTFSATATFQTNGTTLSGVLNYAGYPFALAGSCNSGGVTFTLTETGDTFSGTFAANSGGAPRAAIAGTYTNVYYGSTQNWTATPQ
jgi:hypothetical protein